VMLHYGVFVYVLVMVFVDAMVVGVVKIDAVVMVGPLFVFLRFTDLLLTS